MESNSPTRRHTFRRAGQRFGDSPRETCCTVKAVAVGAAVQVAVLTGEEPSHAPGLLLLDVAHMRARVEKLVLDSTRFSLGPAVDCMHDSGIHRNVYDVIFVIEPILIPRVQVMLLEWCAQSGSGLWRGNAGCSAHRRGTVAGA